VEAGRSQPDVQRVIKPLLMNFKLAGLTLDILVGFGGELILLEGNNEQDVVP
jgi:hypothetical protein